MAMLIGGRGGSFAYLHKKHMWFSFPFLAFQVPKGGQEHAYIERDIYGHVSQWRTGPTSTKNYELLVRFSGFAPANLDVGSGK